MKDIKNWLVTIDFTPIDNTVIGYVKFLSQIFTPECIHFVHVQKEEPTYRYLPEEYMELSGQVTEDKKLQLASKVEHHFTSTDVSLKYHVEHGNPFDEVMEVVFKNHVGMVIAGRKQTSSGSGIVSDRLSRNLPCDFLLIPEGCKPTWKNILLTTDFSSHASQALETACLLKGRDNESEMVVLHSYEVPSGYSKLGKSFEEFAEIMKGHASKYMDKWLNGLKPKKTELVLKTSIPLAQQIMDISRQNDVSMIVMGSKGQSRGSLMLLGSNAMKLMKINDEFPLLIVKKEGENMGLLEALKSV